MHYKGKVAHQNAVTNNYLISDGRIGHLEINGGQLFLDLKGDIVDRLGTYEDCTTVEEMNKARRRFGVPELKK